MSLEWFQACQNNNLEEVKRLLENDESLLNAMSDQYYTGLMKAVIWESTDVFFYLIEKGADVNLKNSHGRSVLNFTNSKQNEITFKLIDVVEDIRPYFLEFCKNNKLPIVIYAYFKGGCTDYLNDNNENALFHASSNSYDVFEFIFNRTLHKNVITKNNKNAIFNVHSDEIEKKINMLVSSGLDVNLQDENGNTSLICHTYDTLHDENLYIKALLENGANPNIKNKLGYNAYTLASITKSDTFKTFKQLEEVTEDRDYKKFRDIRKFMGYCGEDNEIEECIKMLDEGFDVNCKSYYGISPLYVAIEEGNLEMVKLLVSRGANFDGIYLSKLTYDYNIESIKFLIEKGLDINCIKGHYPCIFIGILYENYDFVKHLIEKGANINLFNNKHINPLVFALTRNNDEMINLLLENGAYFIPEKINECIKYKRETHENMLNKEGYREFYEVNIDMVNIK